MKVKRIVANIQTTDIGEAAPPQISFACEGGAGTPTLDLSIEVDDVDAAFSRTKGCGICD
jgi:hypothetical protein